MYEVCAYDRGQAPAEADFNLLDTARKVELYGIRVHPAKVSRIFAHFLSVSCDRFTYKVLQIMVCL